MDESQVRNSQFVIAGRNMTEMFQFVEKTFNQVPLLINPPIHLPWNQRILFRWNRVHAFACSDIKANVF